MDKKKTTKLPNREKQDIPKRKVERKKPQEKKSTVDFSKFFNFLSFVVFIVFACFMYKKVVEQEKMEKAIVENTSKEITSTMDIRNENFYNGPKKEVKVEKKVEEVKEDEKEEIVEETKIPEETVVVDSPPKEEIKTEENPKPTEATTVATTEKKEEKKEVKVSEKDKKVSDAKKIEEGK